MINLASIQHIAYWLYKHHIPIFPKLIQLFIFIVYSSSVSYKTTIGKGSFFNHGGFGILINPKVSIGQNCKIGNNVSIVGQSPYKNVPVIKDSVYIGPGAVIQGPVIIESDVIIAPNSVVNKSVPQYAIVAGIPAKIIGWSNKLNYNIFKNESWDETLKPYLKTPI